MPTYEYACRECGEHLEVVQSFKDDALTDCPACDREGSLRKVFSAAGIIFKGSGWHIKDYSDAKSASSGTSGGDTSSDSSSSSSDTSGSDTSDTGSSSSSGSSTGSSKGSSKASPKGSSSGSGSSEAKSA